MTHTDADILRECADHYRYLLWHDIAERLDKIAIEYDQRERELARLTEARAMEKIQL